MLIDSIIIGNRVRKDMGDIESLAESIKRNGLLHPVVIKSDNTLIAGHRRIEAARLLGWEDIPVTVIDVSDLLSAERDENSERKDFTPSEAVAIGRLIEDARQGLTHAARVRAGERTNALARGDSPPPQISYGKTRMVVAAATGLSEYSYRRAKEVVQAAEADPKRFGDLQRTMDDTGNIDHAVKELHARKGKPSRNPALARMMHLRPSREIERATVSLEGICEVLKSIKVSELNPDKRAAWAKSLSKSAATIKSTARRIYG